jgi:hypothetical protein
MTTPLGLCLGGPRPRECAAARDAEEAADTRRLDRASYGRCLEAAVALRWDSFACGGCQAYAHRRIPRDELLGYAQLEAAKWKQARKGLR